MEPEPLCATLQLSPAPRAEPSGQPTGVEISPPPALPAPRGGPLARLTGVEISPFLPRAPGGGPSAQPTGADVSPSPPCAPGGGPSAQPTGADVSPPSPAAGPSWSSIGSEPESRKNSPALYHLAHAFLLVHLLP